MPELSGAARATVGKSHASSALDVKVTWVAVGLAIIGAAFVLSWTAQGGEKRKLFWVNPLTEIEGPSQDFHAHLATAAELLQPALRIPAIYPDRTAPGITHTMHQGFATGKAEHVTPVMQNPPGVLAW